MGTCQEWPELSQKSSFRQNLILHDCGKIVKLRFKIRVKLYFPIHNRDYGSAAHILSNRPSHTR